MTRRTLTLFLAALLLGLTTRETMAQSVLGLGGLPLYFAEQGSPDGVPQFLASSPGCEVWISPDRVQFNRRNQPTVGAQLLGADPRAFLHGETELAGKINYLTGRGAATWRTEVPTFDRVRVDQLYPGISVVYHGNQSHLEYDFQVAPGARPEVITLRFTGTDKIAVNAGGELELFAGTGEICQPNPEIYQTVAGVRQLVAGGYRLVDDRTVAFRVGQYDHAQPLVIDPILNYSTYLGGKGGDSALAVAVNTNDGSFFVAGQTLSATTTKTGGPLATTNAFQKTFQGGSVSGDAFVAKFDKGFNLVYLTYLGGSQDDYASALAVDGAGHAFVGGTTDSADFPVTNRIPGVVGVPGLSSHISGPINPYTGGYVPDGFVAELETNGSSLVYSTFVGGNAEDSILALTIDAADNVYVTGYTLSTNFPCTNAIPYLLAGGYTNQYLNYLACTYTFYNFNAFVAKIASQGARLDFSSYLGGTNLDAGTGIAVDRANNVYVTGYTASTNFPNTNAFQQYLNQSTNNLNNADINYSVYDAFVAKLAPSPTNYHLLYSSFLGSTNWEQGRGIKVDDSGAYVVGYSCSSNYYNTLTNVIFSGLTNNLDGGSFTTNIFVTKIVTTNTSLVNTSSIAWSLVFGGFSRDVGNGLALDPRGDVFVVGTALSVTFPATNGFGLLATNKVSPGTEVFVTAFGPNCTNVLYSVLLGENNNNYGYGIAVDQNSTAYIVGQTYSKNFPYTTAITNVPGLNVQSALSAGLDGVSDGIVAVIGYDPNNPIPYLPSLAIANSKTNSVTVTWPDNYQLEPYVSQFVLESTTNLLAPLITTTNLLGTNHPATFVPGNYWLPVPSPVSLTSTSRFVVQPDSNLYKYFRLANTNRGY